MNDFLAPITTEQHGPWGLVFSVVADAPGGDLTYVVDITSDGIVKGRSTLTRPALDRAKAVDLLRVRALTWVVEYEARDHSGSTGFADL